MSGIFGPLYGNISVTGATFQTSGITGAVAYINPPPSAVGFLLESESTNTFNLRWAIGIAANSTIGMLMEPGRDTGVIPAAGITLSICGSTSTVGTVQKVDITWFIGG